MADEPFISEIGTLLPISLCGRGPTFGEFRSALTLLLVRWAGGAYDLHIAP